MYTGRTETASCEIRRHDLPWMAGAQLAWLSDPVADIRAAILPAAGGEMASLQVRVDGVWQEILHRALAYTQWPCEETAERAPILWPAVGRSFTSDQLATWRANGQVPARNRYQVAGTVYDIDVHGFARKFPWHLARAGERGGIAFAECTFESSQETHPLYPFDFRLSVMYRVGAGTVAIEYKVVAGENPLPMPFSIGNHLALRVPFGDAGRFDDCTLRSPGNRILLQNALCLLSGESVPVDLLTPASLGHRELLDTVLGGSRREDVWLELNDPALLRLRLSHAELSTGRRGHTKDENLLFVFWGDPAGGFFCPEPWVGKPNSLNTGDGAVCLERGQRFVWEIRIQPLTRG